MSKFSRRPRPQGGERQTFRTHAEDRSKWAWEGFRLQTGSTGIRRDMGRLRGKGIGKTGTRRLGDLVAREKGANVDVSLIIFTQRTRLARLACRWKDNGTLIIILIPPLKVCKLSTHLSQVIWVQMCGNCGQIVAHICDTYDAACSERERERGERCGYCCWTWDWLLENDIKYIAYKWTRNWLQWLLLLLLPCCLTGWSLLSTSVSRSKWPVIVSMINGHSKGNKQLRK